MEPPVEPCDSDCCNSGCNPCIFDVYETQKRKYEAYLKNPQNGAPITSNCIKLTSYTTFELIETQQHCDSARILTFRFVDVDRKNEATASLALRYEPGQYFLIKWNFDDDDEFTRAYTPLPLPLNGELTFKILIKIYPDGKMSRRLASLKLGAPTLWRGPYGEFKINYEYKYQIFVAQGSGIAPLFAVITKIVENEDCYSFIRLFYCCKHEGDIFLRGELRELSRYWNFDYEIYLGAQAQSTGANYNETIKGSRLDFDVIAQYLTGKSEVRIHICGSDKFSVSFKEGALNYGLNSNDIYTF